MVEFEKCGKFLPTPLYSLSLIEISYISNLRQDSESER